VAWRRIMKRRGGWWSVECAAQRQRRKELVAFKCGLEEGLSVHLKVSSKCCLFSPFLKNIILN
jgi:hypothetical protein